MAATVTVTSSSFGQRSRSCPCIKPRWIFAIALAATSPGFGVADELLAHRAATPQHMSSPKQTQQRRGHRYLDTPSNRGHPIVYLDPNRQGFSHRHADAKSLLDEALRRGMGGAATRQ